jgi:predicted GNAT family N-acyltransferase
MTFREIAFGSADYRAEWELRESVLRKPLGLSLANEDLSAECDHLHFGLFAENGNLIGSVIAVPLADRTVRLRQMAVTPESAGQGYGARLLRETESALRDRGFGQIVLHARAGAAGFYEKSGYAVTGAEFKEVGIPHLPMAKRL